MRCPNCDAQNSKDVRVKAVRRPPDGTVVRRRHCSRCETTFTTVEQVDFGGLRVKKANGDIVPFNRASIENSIQEAAAGRFWAVGELDEIVSLVENDVALGHLAEPVPTKAIGLSVIEHLGKVGQATQIRYALAFHGRLYADYPDAGWKTAAEFSTWLKGRFPEVANMTRPRGLDRVQKKKASLREPYDRAKLEKNLEATCKGRGASHQVAELVGAVADDVEEALGDQVIVTSGQIAAEVLRSLRGRDPIAYLRYASPIKQFVSSYDYEAATLTLRGRMGG